MAIYEALSLAYDAFFPQAPRATAFLAALARGKGQGRQGRPAVLDLGCATGSQVLALAASGWEGVGYEPCLPMLEAARSKAAALGLEGVTRFEALGMLDAGSHETQGSRDLVLCLGNTLPYLGDLSELARFLEACRGLLAPSGALVLQLLNYTRILDALASGGFAFPDLFAEGFRFSRRYEPRGDQRLDFVTRLEGPGGSVAEGRDALFPFRPGDLLAALASAGFGKVTAHPGWETRAFDEAADSYLVVVATSRPD